MRLRSSDIASTRDPAVDLVKLIAMAMVVCLHCTGYFFPWGQINLSWAVHTTSLPAVPLFFMCSGYLLLGRNASRAGYRYVLSKIWRVVRFCLIFTGVVYGLIYIFGDPDYSYTDIPRMTWLTHGDFFFLWFMFAYAFVLLLYPPVNRLYGNRRAYGIVLGILLAVMCSAFIIDLGHTFFLSVPDPTQMWLWLGYFMLGGFMRRVILPRGLLIWGLPVVWIATIVIQYFVHRHTGITYGTMFYASPYCVVYACWIFLLCLESGIRPSRPLSAVASLFVPVYTLHAFVIEYLLSYMPWTQPGSCLGLTFCTLAITLLLSWLITRIPPVRALFTI